MDTGSSKKLHNFYSNLLLNDVITFWSTNSIDKENGGFYHCLDRDGSLLNTDKSVWVQARETWMFSRLFNLLEKKHEWLDIADNGYKFLLEHCFDTDGRAFFQVTRDGKPLMKRRYWFSESFAAIALIEYYRASGDRASLEKARSTYRMCVDFYENPWKLPPKVYPETRSMKAHAYPMILLSTTQIMREIDDDPIYDAVAQKCVDDLFTCFVKDDIKALMEYTDENGRLVDNPQGRCINPGHAIETAWFLIHEGQYRGDDSIIEKALKILEWSIDRGWDKEFGGILYFVDVDNRPPDQLEWDMKLWWPHTEALYAFLLAYRISGNKLYEEWFERIFEWVFEHFPDKDNGEWYGYLHRDGTVSSPVKGNMWKGPFHLPRFLLNSIKLLENK